MLGNISKCGLKTTRTESKVAFSLAKSPRQGGWATFWTKRVNRWSFKKCGAHPHCAFGLVVRKDSHPKPGPSPPRSPPLTKPNSSYCQPSEKLNSRPVGWFRGKIWIMNDLRKLATPQSFCFEPSTKATDVSPSWLEVTWIQCCFANRELLNGR